MAEPQIVACGGLGEDDEAGRLIGFVLGLTGKERPRVCLVPTASSESPEYMLRFYENLSGHADCSHVSFFPWPREGLREHVLSQDAIFVSGGNTANMLAVWRVHELHRILRRAWEDGIVLAGLSAGSICWFEGGTTDSFGGLDPLRDGLGFLAGSLSPHYDGETERRPAYQRLVASGELPPGYAADDGAALVFRGNELLEVVAERAGARAYRVERGPDGTAIETPIETRFLG
jgi:dipeptidase E